MKLKYSTTLYLASRKIKKNKTTFKRNKIPVQLYHWGTSSQKEYRENKQFKNLREWKKYKNVGKVKIQLHYLTKIIKGKVQNSLERTSEKIFRMTPVFSGLFYKYDITTQKN